ncbi:hypothetical protein O3P69_008431 [Scylla paramamosain]|uniref:Uncharacterized protein n=1 Tax=Scylla paramamosain TaxID=85552 RepID=A0AAW0SJQ1_SCYPA
MAVGVEGRASEGGDGVQHGCGRCTGGSTVAAWLAVLLAGCLAPLTSPHGNPCTVNNTTLSGRASALTHARASPPLLVFRLHFASESWRTHSCGTHDAVGRDTTTQRAYLRRARSEKLGRVSEAVVLEMGADAGEYCLLVSQYQSR